MLDTGKWMEFDDNHQKEFFPYVFTVQHSPSCVKPSQ